MKKIILAICLFVLGACGENEGKGKVLRLAHPLPETHPHHAASLRFAELVKERTDGKYSVEIYPNAQLGTPIRAVEMSKSGLVDFVIVSMTDLEGFNPYYKSFTLPYLYKDRNHFMNALYGEEVEQIYASLSNTGFYVLSAYEGGFRNLYTKTPITSLEEMKGKRIRVQESETMINLINSLGGLATPMAYTEIFTAIQQNVLDGAENNPISYTTSGHFEIAKNYILTEHSSIPDTLIVSTKSFSGLTSEEKEIFKSAARDASKLFSESWDKINKEELARVVKDEGVKVITIDKAPFINKVKYMHDQLAQQGEKYQEIINYIRSKE